MIPVIEFLSDGWMWVCTSGQNISDYFSETLGIQAHSLKKKMFPGRFFSKHVIVIERKGIFKELPYIPVLCICHFLTFNGNSLERSSGQPEVARRCAQQPGEDRWLSLCPFNISLRNERLMLSNSVAYMSWYWWVRQGSRLLNLLKSPGIMEDVWETRFCQIFYSL